MLDREAFGHAVHNALSHLYDPTSLRRSPLVQALGLSERSQPLRALRSALTTGIANLRPEAHVPQSSSAERLYRILNDRYLEHFTQQQVALDMSLSIRQLRRLEKQAVDVLADALWRKRVPPEEQPSEAVTASETATPPSTHSPAHTKELERMREAQLGPVDLGELIDGILSTLRPYLANTEVSVDRQIANLPSPAYAEVITLRQALVNIISSAARAAQGCTLRIASSSPDARAVRLTIRALCDTTSAGKTMSDEALHLTESLLGISEASLNLQQAQGGEAFCAVLTIPVQREITVMGIDDNRDILRMLERYLSATRYRFTGCDDPQEALAQAERDAPDVIVMDIMLPGMDGWELVGRLRENPSTQDTPILICSILPQEELAAMLGAAGFIRKPVSRASLLRELARHCPG